MTSSLPNARTGDEGWQRLPRWRAIELTTTFVPDKGSALAVELHEWRSFPPINRADSIANTVSQVQNCAANRSLTNAVATQGFTDAEQHQLRTFLRRMIASLADAPATRQEGSE